MPLYIQPGFIDPFISQWTFRLFPYVYIVIMNNAAVNIGALISLQDLDFSYFVYTPRNGIARTLLLFNP